MEPVKRARAALAPGPVGEAVPASDTDRQADRKHRAALRPKSSLPSDVPINHVPPRLPADLPQSYLPVVGGPPAANAALLYQPRLLAVADVLFTDRKRGVEHRQQYSRM